MGEKKSSVNDLCKCFPESVKKSNEFTLNHHTRPCALRLDLVSGMIYLELIPKGVPKMQKDLQSNERDLNNDR